MHFIAGRKTLFRFLARKVFSRHYHQFHTADHHYGKEGFPECYINLCTFLEFDREELIDGIGYNVVKKCLGAQCTTIQSMMNASLKVLTLP